MRCVDICPVANVAKRQIVEGAYDRPFSERRDNRYKVATVGVPTKLGKLTVSVLQNNEFPGTVDETQVDGDFKPVCGLRRTMASIVRQGGASGSSEYCGAIKRIVWLTVSTEAD